LHCAVRRALLEFQHLHVRDSNLRSRFLLHNPQSASTHIASDCHVRLMEKCLSQMAILRVRMMFFFYSSACSRGSTTLPIRQACTDTSISYMSSILYNMYSHGPLSSGSSLLSRKIVTAVMCFMPSSALCCASKKASVQPRGFPAVDQHCDARNFIWIRLDVQITVSLLDC
jgi:hypothetical protein